MASGPTAAILQRIHAICTLKAKLPITVLFAHIYGHLDDWTPYSHLSRLEQLNMKMDHQAKVHLLQLIHQQPPPQVPRYIIHEGWHCMIAGSKPVSDPRKVIQQHIFCAQLKEHLVTR